MQAQKWIILDGSRTRNKWKRIKHFHGGGAETKDLKLMLSCHLRKLLGDKRTLVKIKLVKI